MLSLLLFTRPGCCLSAGLEERLRALEPSVPFPAVHGDRAPGLPARRGREGAGDEPGLAGWQASAGLRAEWGDRAVGLGTLGAGVVLDSAGAAGQHLPAGPRAAGRHGPGTVMGGPSGGCANAWDNRCSPARCATREARPPSLAGMNDARTAVPPAFRTLRPARATPVDIDGLQVQVGPLTDPEALAFEWQALEREAESSFFTSWTWMSCWLEHLDGAAARGLLLLRVRQDGRTVGLGLWSRRTLRRLRCLPSRALLLHATGRPELDDLSAEHNALLARADIAGAVESAAYGALLGRCPGVDQVVVPRASALPPELASLAARTRRRLR